MGSCSSGRRAIAEAHPVGGSGSRQTNEAQQVTEFVGHQTNQLRAGSWHTFQGYSGPPFTLASTASQPTTRGCAASRFSRVGHPSATWSHSHQPHRQATRSCAAPTRLRGRALHQRQVTALVCARLTWAHVLRRPAQAQGKVGVSSSPERVLPVHWTARIHRPLACHALLPCRRPRSPAL